jgi:AGCS family alanine or glycine:cation symporter
MSLELFRRAILWASDFVWGPWMLFLLLGAGLFLTLRYRFVQVRLFPQAARTLVPAQQEGARGALSPFQAFMTALGASIGTGNIAGVATAVVSGGPGAVFWIWCYGFFATVIKFTEAMLGIRYRSIEGGHVSAGPMYYLRDGLRSPALAWIYALVAGVAALTTTPFTQPNSMAVVLESQFRIPTWASGIGIAVLAWLVIIGGVRSIGRVAEKLAPLKVGLYLAGGLWVILFHAGQVPEVFALIFREAFSL